MTLQDEIEFGMSLPHRSSAPISVEVIGRVAQRAEALGFRDLWVSNNTVDEAGCFNSLIVLTHAAALTTTIRLGVSVLVLPTQQPIQVAHQVATLDYLSAGRAVLGVGLGRADEYVQFQVPTERRVTRFTESIELIKALWAGPHALYQGEIYRVHDVTLGTRPVQRPHPPIWVGGAHPAARRDPDGFPISKRVFVSVHERHDVARSEIDRWFCDVYRKPSGTDQFGVYGTPEEVRQQLEALATTGATHLLLNPVCRYTEQLEALAEIVGLSARRD